MRSTNLQLIAEDEYLQEVSFETIWDIIHTSRQSRELFEKILATANPKAVMDLLTKSDSEDLLRFAGTSASDEHRTAVGGNKNAPIDLLAELAKDGSKSVRLAIYSNPAIQSQDIEAPLSPKETSATWRKDSPPRMGSGSY